VNILSWIRGLASRDNTAARPEDPLSLVQWVAAADNPFGVELLDCSSFARSMIATTGDPAIADLYARLRKSMGDQYRGCVPETSASCECDVRYPHKGATRDGPLFKAVAMEDKWDIYLYDGALYFARSWSGELEYVARITFCEDGAHVIAVSARKALVDSDPLYPIAAVDYLIRSHLYRMPVPHPLPKALGREPRQLALFSFSQYGRYGLYGTFADTTRLQLPERHDASGADV
jgi:hypothetical protein